MAADPGAKLTRFLSEAVQLCFNTDRQRAPGNLAKEPGGGISRTGNGDTLRGKCLRSSHHPEAVHLHLTLTHLNRVPLIVLSGAG